MCFTPELKVVLLTDSPLITPRLRGKSYRLSRTVFRTISKVRP